MGPKVGFFGPMKTLDSARQGVEHLPGGRLRAWIEHEPMRGVTPEMLRWWFEHIDGWTNYNGTDFSGPAVPVYRLWHPFDHIAVSWETRVTDDRGRLTAGSVIRIEENLGARYPVRVKAMVTRFDDEAFNFEVRLGGVLPVGELDHLYHPVPEGCAFYTETRTGVDVPIVAPVLNALIQRFQMSEALLRTWILHNIEESGETEKFVPQLFAHACRGTAGDASD